MNRYYASQWGRFLTPDPYRASGGTSDPGSWNRYAYTRGDPINRSDFRGLCDASADGPYSVTVCGNPDGGNPDRDDSGGGIGNGRQLPDEGGTCLVGSHLCGGANSDERVAQAGRGPGSDNIIDAVANLRAAELAIEALDFRADCLRDFAAVGVSADQVRNGVYIMNFRSGWGNRDNYADAVWSNSGAYGANKNIFKDTTVGQYFASHPGTAAVAQALESTVFIDATWVNSFNKADVVGLVLHEVLHNLTGDIDVTLQQKLNTVLAADQQLKVGDASKNISDALVRDCL